jgi:hypothetical protein
MLNAPLSLFVSRHMCGQMRIEHIEEALLRQNRTSSFLVLVALDMTRFSYQRA